MRLDFEDLSIAVHGRSGTPFFVGASQVILAKWIWVGVQATPKAIPDCVGVYLLYF